MFKVFSKNSIKIFNLNDEDHKVKTYYYCFNLLLFTRTKAVKVRREQPEQIFKPEFLINGHA